MMKDEIRIKEIIENVCREMLDRDIVYLNTPKVFGDSIVMVGLHLENNIVVSCHFSIYELLNLNYPAEDKVRSVILEKIRTQEKFIDRSAD